MDGSCHRHINPVGVGCLRRSDDANNHAELDNVHHYLGPDDHQLAVSDDHHTKCIKLNVDDYTAGYLYHHVNARYDDQDIDNYRDGRCFRDTR